MTIENRHIEVLAFRLGQEEYGVDILKIQEIHGHDPATRIAAAPDFIEGIVDLRGIIVPIVDLRLRSGIATAKGQTRVVVILNIGGRVIGMVVDAVSNVVRLGPADIRPAPDLAAPLARASCSALAPSTNTC